ncbi:hypothetical protein SARC_07093 [Sphaeroforma arctica JP610]|uniref:Uncharacterized protein n=1 Tax=Sphaeroforma arctica JP610 TaxID=667725 RepID=A0A0L0FVG0_9EUKA|nr:hypothetical protein SARC_07093 [Sphaeroforma arctica JP610]KNC80546.1 hypothetical protein SARC_07093 [Sphaeroforma arctica JP610]|eukprot:XP_014154448.1 hypothetical protein SARC_07093 [Sphaeroforma arctica JP610]
MFWYFNMPEFYENYVEETKRRVLHEDEETRQIPQSLEGVRALRKELLEKRRIKAAMESNLSADLTSASTSTSNSTSNVPPETKEM